MPENLAHVPQNQATRLPPLETRTRMYSPGAEVSNNPSAASFVRDATTTLRPSAKRALTTRCPVLPVPPSTRTASVQSRPAGVLSAPSLACASVYVSARVEVLFRGSPLVGRSVVRATNQSKVKPKRATSTFACSSIVYDYCCSSSFAVCDTRKNIHGSFSCRLLYSY